jgi:hypothetical protein
MPRGSNHPFRIARSISIEGHFHSHVCGWLRALLDDDRPFAGTLRLQSREGQRAEGASAPDVTGCGVARCVENAKLLPVPRPNPDADIRRRRSVYVDVPCVLGRWQGGDREPRSGTPNGQLQGLTLRRADKISRLSGRRGRRRPGGRRSCRHAGLVPSSTTAAEKCCETSENQRSTLAHDWSYVVGRASGPTRASTLELTGLDVSTIRPSDDPEVESE